MFYYFRDSLVTVAVVKAAAKKEETLLGPSMRVIHFYKIDFARVD